MEPSTLPRAVCAAIDQQQGKGGITESLNDQVQNEAPQGHLFQIPAQARMSRGSPYPWRSPRRGLYNLSN